MTDPKQPHPPLEAASTPMADKAMARLYNFGEGNGLDKDDAQLILATEGIYKVLGTITLSPRFSTTIQYYSGPAKKGKDVKVFPSINAMQGEIAQRKKAFEKGGSWFSDAITEVKHTKDHGWGHDDADIIFPNDDVQLASTETCPSCNGAGRHTCPKCRGQKTITCVFCHGQKEEECYNCFFKGVDPTNPKQACPVCQGRRYAPCRQCQGTGLQNCPECQARGSTTCPECKGTGKITQEVTINAGAKMSFKLDRFAETPSGLLRMVDRIGVANLVKGHADIKMLPQDPYEEKTIVKLQAEIPYAELKTRFFGKPTLISVFGKRNMLSGVPTYLDECTKKARAALTDAAANKGPLDAALTARIIRDALRNALMGKTHPDDLRRIYPVGLSAEVANEIMRNIMQALHNATRQSRLILAASVTIGGTALFATLFMTPIWKELTSQLPVIAQYVALLPPWIITLGLAHGILTYVTGRLLKKNHPDMPVNKTQKIGTIGYVTLTLLTAIYAAIVILSGSA